MINRTNTYTLTDVVATAGASIMVGGWIVIFIVLISDLNRTPASLPPCPTEDSHDCHWIASERGNGAGMSFVNIDGNHVEFTN